MKSKMFFLVLLFTFSGLMGTSCTKDSEKGDPVFALPPETQVGANTFGVTINGKVYVPRDPTGWSLNPATKGLSAWSAPNNISWNEIRVIDGASTTGFRMVVHIQNLQLVGTEKYILKNSNFQDQVDSTPHTHIFFKLWSSTISNYVYYGSIENLGELNVTRNSNDITSGNFKGKFVRYDNPNDFIIITDGRFDIGPGLYDKVFP